MKQTLQYSIRVLTLAGLGMALTGCSSISFLYSLMESPNDLATDVDISGVWSAEAGKETWTFAKRQNGAYLLTWRDKDETLVLDAQVVRLSNYLFLDVASHAEGTAVEGHQFARLRADSGSVQIAWLDGNWMEKKLAEERALTFERPCKTKDRRCFVVTAESRDLQNFLLRHVLDAKAFDKWTMLKPVD